MGVLLIGVIVAIAILVTSNNNKSNPTAHKSTTPSGSASPTPSPTTTPSATPSPPSSANAQLQAATALDSLLTDSSRNRANVVAAVASVANCSRSCGRRDDADRKRPMTARLSYNACKRWIFQH